MKGKIVIDAIDATEAAKMAGWEGQKERTSGVRVETRMQCTPIEAVEIVYTVAQALHFDELMTVVLMGKLLNKSDYADKRKEIKVASPRDGMRVRPGEDPFSVDYCPPPPWIDGTPGKEF